MFSRGVRTDVCVLSAVCNYCRPQSIGQRGQRGAESRSSSPAPDSVHRAGGKLPRHCQRGQAEANQSLVAGRREQCAAGRGVPTSVLLEIVTGDRGAVFFAVPQLDPYHAHRDRKRTSRPHAMGIDGPLALRTHSRTVPGSDGLHPF